MRRLVAQMAVAPTIALRTAKHHAAATDAVAITMLVSVARQLIIVSLW